MRAKRFLNRLLAPLQLLLWRMNEPHAKGSKALIECSGSYLMVQNLFGAKLWTFPGGRQQANETPEETAHRKILEEVGITLPPLTYLGSYFHTRQYKKDVICTFYAKVATPDHILDRENFADSGWFTFAQMAELQRSPSVDDVLGLFGRHKTHA